MSRVFHSSYLRAVITSSTLAVLAVLVGPVEQAPATGDLQAAYAFNEGTGTTAEDLSENGNVASLQNGAAWTESGRFGNGLSLDGEDDVVEIANSSTLNPTSAITLSAWVRTQQIASQSVFYKSGSTNPPYALKLHSAGGVAAQVTIGGQTHAVGSETRYLTSEWMYLTVTYDGATIRLYMNGRWKAAKPRQARSLRARDRCCSAANPSRTGSTAGSTKCASTAARSRRRRSGPTCSAPWTRRRR